MKPVRFVTSIALLSLLSVACLTDVPPAEAPPAGDRLRAVLEDPLPVGAIPEVKNVLLLTVDTLRADFVGTYGGPARTPNLDRLAAQGWKFNECISASMLTSPSHASMMTSLYPHDHGVYDNESGIHDGMRTLASQLKDHGFQTAALIGFPHLNPEVSNLGQGFDSVVPATRKERRAKETSHEALRLIDEFDAERPFFAWFHYVDPHAPYEPPEELIREDSISGATPMARAVRAAPGFQKRNEWFQQAFAEHDTTEDLVRRYVAEIEATDAGLGVLLEGLVARGLDRNTAIIVTSDHGENMGEHALYFHHGGLYRESVHVPLIISAVGARSRAWSDQVHSVDIAPTILDWLGVPRWEPMRGHSLLDMVRGTGRGRDVVFSEHMGGLLVSARSRQGTLILHQKTSRQFPSYPFRAGYRELYDLRRDPFETRPLPAEGDLAHELEEALQRYLGLGLKVSARPAINQDRESLRALGYVE